MSFHFLKAELGREQNEDGREETAQLSSKGVRLRIDSIWIFAFHFLLFLRDKLPHLAIWQMFCQKPFAAALRATNNSFTRQLCFA